MQAVPRLPRVLCSARSSARGLVVCEKISQTPTVYPRNGGKIAKKPL